MKNLLAVLFAIIIISTGTAYAEWTPMPYTDKIGIDTNAFNIYGGETFTFHLTSKTDSTSVMRLYRKDLDESIVTIYSDTVQFKSANVGKGSAGVVINGKAGSVSATSLSTTGAMTVNGTLTANGTSNFNGTVDLNALTTSSAGLQATADVDFTDTMTVTGKIIGNGDWLIGNASADSIVVNGAVQNNADVVMKGNLYFGGPSTIIEFGDATGSASAIYCETGIFKTGASEIGIGNSITNDTTTFNCDINGTANMDVNLTQSGVTVRTASLTATNDTSTNIYATGAFEAQGSNIRLGNLTSADTVTVTAQIKASSGAGFDYSAGTAGDFIVPNASIGTAEIADSAVTCNKLSVSAGTEDIHLTFKGGLGGLAAVNYLMFVAQETGTARYAYYKGSGSYAENTVTIQIVNQTKGNTVTNVVLSDITDYSSRTTAPTNFTISNPNISAGDVIYCVVQMVQGVPDLNTTKVVLGFRRNE